MKKSLHGTIAPNCYPTYMNEFDWIKRHSVLERLQTLAGEKAEKTDLDKKNFISLLLSRSGGDKCRMESIKKECPGLGF